MLLYLHLLRVPMLILYWRRSQAQERIHNSFCDTTVDGMRAIQYDSDA